MSAVGAAAGFAPIAIGGKTDGSLNIPATRASLYTVKPTADVVASAGVLPLAPFYDSTGPMAKCARDVADLLDVLVDEATTQIPQGGYRACLRSSFENLRFGVLDPTAWSFPADMVAP